METIDWRNFWNTYRKKQIENEGDLFVEVGKTVQGRSISTEQFRLTIERVVRLLWLQPNDRLLELCCGNGLMTRALAPLVREIEAVDFSEHLIAHARLHAAVANVRYICAEVLEHLALSTASRQFLPTKILLGDALAYFEPVTFRMLLERISGLTNGRFLFLATNVPCDELRWNFYNTPERRQRYAENRRQSANTNDGLGRWWKREELRRAGEMLQLEVTLFDQPASLSDYRIDVFYEGPASES